MEYKVVWAWTLAILEKDVNAAIADGWTLQGGVSVTSKSEHSSTTYFQAMTKRYPR